MSGCPHGKNPLLCGVCTPPEKAREIAELQRRSRYNLLTTWQHKSQGCRKCSAVADGTDTE